MRIFLLPGRLPLAWTRSYSSADLDEEGLCGYGWSTPADTRLEILADEGVAVLTQPEGMTLFAALPQSDGREQGYCRPAGRQPPVAGNPQWRMLLAC